MQAVDQLMQGVDEFVEEYVGKENYHPKWPAHPKIIHDPLWGTIRLHPWEIAVLDLPLIQRLRQIRQTSLVSYVFPGCNHSRFEHTLGVIHQTQKLCEAVNGQPNRRRPFTAAKIRDLRLAALFHDCGHGCFSHLSEDIYQFCADMEPVLDDEGEYPGGNPHEVLGALILRSQPVRDYLDALSDRYDVKFDIDRAAGWIVGDAEQQREIHRHTAQVINGPFDADKLDYIFRDAHYSGLPLTLDLDRLWACCTASKQSWNNRILTLHRGATTPLEQILFSKINLFSVVYQHPKVRAAEAMLHGVIEYMREHRRKLGGRDLRRATDYLWTTDDTFFSTALRTRDETLHRLIHNILYRRHYVRALTISKATVDVEKHGDNYLRLRRLNHKRIRSSLDERRQLAKEIWKTSRADCTEHEVWLDLPPDPPKGEADRIFVRMPSDEFVRMSEVFPTNYWADLYLNHKWRGHVFCPPEHQKTVHNAAVKVLGDAYDVEFNDLARTLSHVPE